MPSLLFTVEELYYIVSFGHYFASLHKTRINLRQEIESLTDAFNGRGISSEV